MHASQHTEGICICHQVKEEPSQLNQRSELHTVIKKIYANCTTSAAAV
jgi:hypothetical protein